MITFNPDTGLISSGTAAIRANLVTQWQKAFATDPNKPLLDTAPETPAGQLIDGQAVLINRKDSEILYLANMFNPKTALGIWQDALAGIYFIERHVAIATLVTGNIKGAYGTVIPYGAIVQDQKGYTYTNVTVTTIGEDGTATAIFRCSQRGAIEIGVGQLTKIVTVVPGWDSITNLAAGVTGRNSETQAEFEQRRRASVAQNAHGIASAVEGALANLSDVVAVSVLENRGDTDKVLYGVTLPPHSIYCSVYGGNIESIAKTIHEKIDGGCGISGNTKIAYVDEKGNEFVYYIEIPTTTTFALSVKIRKTSTLPTNYEEQIKKVVLQNFNGELNKYGRAKMAQTIYASRFYADIVDVGVDNLENIEISYPSGSEWTDSVDIPANQIPVMSESNITITVLE